MTFCPWLGQLPSPLRSCEPNLYLEILIWSMMSFIYEETLEICYVTRTVTGDPII